MRTWAPGRIARYASTRTNLAVPWLKTTAGLISQSQCTVSAASSFSTPCPRTVCGGGLIAPQGHFNAVTHWGKRCGWCKPPGPPGGGANPLGPSHVPSARASPGLRHVPSTIDGPATAGGPSTRRGGPTTSQPANEAAPAAPEPHEPPGGRSVPGRGLEGARSSARRDGTSPPQNPHKCIIGLGTLPARADV